MNTTSYRVHHTIKLASAIICFVLASIVLLAGMPLRAAAQSASGLIYTVEARGTITSVTLDHLRRALQIAEAADANALIITLSNNGGVLRDTRLFAAEIATARIPIVVYIAPSGTQSGAVGAMLASAAHISALAPDTSFGSAYPLTEVDAALSDQSRNMVLDSVADQLREWNSLRGRNTDWVDQATRTGAILTNEQAMAVTPPAVDLVAVDQAQLLTLLDGRIVTLDSGNRVKISTLGRPVVQVAPTLFEQLRLALADPTVAFVLLVLGAMAIYLELAAPGSTFFAGIGIILLLSAASGLLVLPMHWWAILLILLALAVIGAEFVVPAHGGLLVTGLALLVVGAMNLIDPAQAPGTGVSIWALGLVALGFAGSGGFAAWLALRSRNQPMKTGQDTLVGQLAEVRQRLDPRGMVFVEGALWQAISEDGPVDSGDWVRITAVHNLQLIVRPLEQATAIED